MNITFGICVGNDIQYLERVVESIYDQDWGIDDDFEIIFAGDTVPPRYEYGDDTFVLKDYEERKPMWITKKKNDIAKYSPYENVVLMHDYLALAPNWLETHKKIEDDWKILLCPVKNFEGTRHADWLVDPHLMNAVIQISPDYTKMLMDVAPHENGPQYVSGLPYNERNLSHIQYVSGGYVFLKKEVIKNVPMDEELIWGQAEDLEWSRRLRLNKIKFTFNPDTHIQILKPGKWHCYQMPDEFKEILKTYYGEYK